MYQIRHAIEADYEAMAVIATLIRPEPSSAQELLISDRRAQADPDIVIHRLVAVDPAGRVVGYGFTERSVWEPEGRWGVYAAAHPDERGRGVGSSLLEAAERIAREGGATELHAWTQGTDDPSLAWAERRGYVMNRQRTESVLDLKRFDPTPFAGTVDRVRKAGITFSRYACKELSEPLLRQVYELDKVTSPDIPVWDAGDNFPSWEQYRRDWLGATDPGVIALAQDCGRVVGISTVWYSDVTPGKCGYVGYTAVLREYRGKSIATALKLLTIEDAMKRGVPRLRTNNDPDNPPMLAVNVKLGFQFVPGPRRLVKALSA